MRQLSPLILLLVVSLSSTACTDVGRYQVILSDTSEAVEVGQPVFLDDLQVGTVDTVGEEGGDRVANLKVDMTAAGDGMREGVVRVPVHGRIQLKSSPRADARPLSKGARIPTRSGLLTMITSYSSNSALMTAGVAVVAFVVIYLVFRSLVGAIGLIICTALAAVLTQFVYLYLAPWVLRIYERFPAANVEPLPAASATEAATTVVGRAMEQVTEIMSSRPDPRLVAWCLVFLTTFIVLNIVLGRVSRVWRR